MLKIISIVTIAVLSCGSNSCAKSYEYDPIDEIVLGKEVPSYVMSLSFHASLDPKLIHSHKVKMRWSKVRHSDTFDPADPNAMEEPEDMKKRPTVCYTFIQGVANMLFASLASHLPLEEARRVMVWRNEDAMKDMIPNCRTIKRKHPTVLDNDDNEVELLDYDYLDETCNIDFLTSLFPYYGIGFNLTLGISNKPMSNLSYDDIVKRTTPNKRGATQPIRTSDVTVNILLMSPDFTSEKTNSASFQRKKQHQVLESNVESALETLMQKTQILFGGAIPVNIRKKDLGNMLIELDSIPDYQKVDGVNDDKEESTDNNFKIDEAIWKICEEHNLSLDECKMLQKHLEAEIDDEDMELEAKAEDDDESNVPMDSDATNDKKDRSGSESNKKRQYTAGKKAQTMEEKVKIQKDFEALDKFINGFEDTVASLEDKNVDSGGPSFKKPELAGTESVRNIEKLEALVKTIHLSHNESLNDYDVDSVDMMGHEEL